MNIPFLPLKEVIKFKGGGTPSKKVPEYWDGDIPWATVKDFKTTRLTETQDRISRLGLEKSAANLIPAGHVIIPTRMALGKAAINTTDLAINQDLRALIPRKKVHTEYLLYAMLDLAGEIEKRGSGATVKGITQENLYSLKIPVPDYEDQIRIATLLSRVETLIATRKNNLQQLDDFLKSTFLEMFGDPVRNEKEWEMKPLSKLGSIDRGVSKHRPRNAPELLGGNYPLIQTGEVSNSGTYIKEYKHTYSEVGFKQSKLWPAGTLCITIAANIAQTSILTFDACFPDSVVGFVPNKGTEILYVHFLFSFLQRILEKNAPKAAQRNINLAILRGLTVPSPSPEIQSNFSRIVGKVEKLKTNYEQNLSELETLYAALSQKAFKGDLDLSRIPLPEKHETTEHAERAEKDKKDVSVSPVDEKSFTDPVQRNQLLSGWFNDYRATHNTQPFSVEAFWQFAEQRSEELTQSLETEDSPPLGLADYEQLKTWLFTQIEQGKLTQAFSIDDKKIGLKVKS